MKCCQKGKKCNLKNKTQQNANDNKNDLFKTN